ncbi:MAG: ABC transporter ATP-binding protein [Aeromonas sp.]
MTTTTPLLKVSNVTKTVTVGPIPLTILEAINVEVKRGETIALVGASGSGKSTLLGLLAGLDLPSNGEIELLGQRLDLGDEETRARLRGQHIGFIFQAFLLLPSFSALENVMLAAELQGESDCAPRAKALLEAVGLGDRLQQRPAQLSGGEQQRVAIARAFMTRPTLLLADEPTGNLDSATGETVIDLLFRLNQAHGTTLIIVTHDKALAARCQRQWHLVGGRLAAPQASGDGGQGAPSEERA